MKNVYTYANTTWIDLHQPSAEELTELIEAYHLPVDLHDALQSPSTKPAIELYHGALFAIFTFPAFQHTHSRGNTSQEIDFIILDDVIITVHYDTIDALHKFGKMLETQSILGADSFASTHTPSVLFFAIMKKMYKSIYHEIEFVEDWIDGVERDIFAGNEHDMVFALSRVNRRLLDIKKIIHLHDELLRSLRSAGDYLGDEQFKVDCKTLLAEYHTIEETLENNMAIVDELRATNNSLLSTKQNEAMRTISAVAYVTLPITTIAAIFSMNATQSMPLVGETRDFWIIVTMMLVAVLAMLTLFKYKRWL